MVCYICATQDGFDEPWEEDLDRIVHEFDTVGLRDRTARSIVVLHIVSKYRIIEQTSLLLPPSYRDVYRVIGDQSGDGGLLGLTDPAIPSSGLVLLAPKPGWRGEDDVPDAIHGVRLTHKGEGTDDDVDASRGALKALKSGLDESMTLVTAETTVEGCRSDLAERQDLGIMISETCMALVKGRALTSVITTTSIGKLKKITMRSRSGG